MLRDEVLLGIRGTLGGRAVPRKPRSPITKHRFMAVTSVTQNGNMRADAMNRVGS